VTHAGGRLPVVLSTGGVGVAAGISPMEQRALASMSRFLETVFEDRRALAWHVVFWGLL